MQRCFIAAIWTIVIFLYCIEAVAETKFNSGFTTISICHPKTDMCMDMAVWYPTRRLAHKITYKGWTIRGAHHAQVAHGIHPLILLSHDTAGSRFTHHWLAEGLSKEGFIVIALTHRSDNLNISTSIFTLEQIEGRVNELKSLLDIILGDTFSLSKSINKERIGIVGFGPGGTAALLLAGGRLNGGGWNSYCRRAGNLDPYCSHWAIKRMQDMFLSIDTQRSYRDSRINSAAIIAPSYGMFFSNASLRDVKIPILLLRADLDTINRAPHHSEVIRDALSCTVEYGILNFADHASLMSQCPKKLEALLPDMCIPTPPARREETHYQLLSKAVHFFKLVSCKDEVAQIKMSTEQS